MIKLDQIKGTITVDDFTITPDTTVDDFAKMQDKVSICRYSDGAVIVTFRELQVNNGIQGEIACIYEPNRPLRVKISTRFTRVKGNLYTKTYAQNLMEQGRTWLKGMTDYTNTNFDRRMNLRFGEFGTIECVYYYCIKNDIYNYDDINIELWKERPEGMKYNIER